MKVVSSNNSKTSVVFNHFFRRLLVIARARSVDQISLFAHELSPVTYSVAYKDETLRKGPKSNLLSLLEGDITVTYSTPSMIHMTAWIFDAMALVQRNRPSFQNTFGEYAEYLLLLILKPLALENCNRVNVVSDRYDRAFSIKAGERVRRQGSSSMHFYIHDICSIQSFLQKVACHCKSKISRPNKSVCS